MPKQPSEIDDDQTISTTGGAALLGVTPRWVQELKKLGYIEPVSRGEWSLKGLVQGYIAFLKDDEKRNSKSAAASRVTDARTREIELKIAQRKGQLIDRDEHEALLDLVTGRYLGSLGGIPAQVSRDPTERERIERIIDQERERLADYFDEVADNIAPVVDDDPAIEADDAARVGGSQ